VPPSVAPAFWGLGFYTYGPVSLGAYVAPPKSSLACLAWPLCQGSVFPGFTGPVGIVFSHRLSAVVLTLGVVALAAWCWRRREARPDLAWASAIALGTVLLQSAAGAAIVFTRLSLFSALSHSAIITLYFGALAYLCLNVLPRPLSARTAEVPAHQAGDQATRTVGTAQRADALTR